jgi:hypothetical protein
MVKLVSIWLLTRELSIEVEERTGMTFRESVKKVKWNNSGKDKDLAHVQKGMACPREKATEAWTALLEPQSLSQRPRFCFFRKLVV